MLIYIAGVCHQDPKGKNNLKKWLHDLSANNDGPPAFVGVEYNEGTFAALRKQRPILRKRVKSMCPRASSALLEALVECLAYEPDAVADVFPNVKWLWLEKCTTVPDDLYGYEDPWIKEYKRYYSQEKVLFLAACARVLDLMSDAAWESFEKKEPQIQVPDPERRDEKFARLVLDTIGQLSEGWAIVVVGASHAANKPGRMRYRLTTAGIECKAYWIKPNGPVPA